MRHISIGEIFINDDTSYDAVFFKGKIKKHFDNVNDLLDEIKLHFEGMVKHGISRALCMEVYNISGYKHYIMIDNLWDGKVNGDYTIIFESTDYEYRMAHPQYLGTKEYRRIINERRYSFNDILRTSSHWRPWWSITLMMLVFLLITFVAIYFISSFDVILNSNVSELDSNLFLLYDLLVVFLTMVLVFFVIWSAFKLKKLITNSGENYELVNWVKFYKNRRLSLRVALIMSIMMMGISIHLSYHLISVDFTKQVSILGHVMFPLLIHAIGIINLLIFLFIFITLILMRAIKKNQLKYYYTPEEIIKFNYWLISGEGENVIKSKSDIGFFFDVATSEFINAKEIEVSRSFWNDATKKERREYKQRAIKHFRVSVDSYLEFYFKDK